jgi:xanthine dehydrogenase YagT iron-sulfur-binding subunit
MTGRPTVLAFLSREWDPTRPHQLAYLESLLGGAVGGDDALPALTEHDVYGDTAAEFGVLGEQALLLLDGSGREAWRHVGALTPGVERSLAVALEGLSPQSSADDPSSERSHPTRREFVATAVAAAIIAVVTPMVARAESVRSAIPADSASSAAASIRLNINGRDVALDVEPRVTLLDALREYAGMTGTKKGCDHGQCGACTVHINGRRQLSCMTFAVMQQGAKITTVEGLAIGDTLHPMQAAFIKHDGFQCGYCTPGQLMSATALLTEPCGPADVDVKECMSGNICRCGAYPGIVAAIQDVRSSARG